MLATLTVAALICAASLLVGEAVARLLALDRWRGWSPAMGLALLIAVALAAVKLPGHGSTASIVLGVVVAVCALVVGRSGWPPRPPWHVVGLTATTLIAALIPYISNQRFGIPAVGYTNDPAAHLTWAFGLQSHPADEVVTAGYPIGPHSLLAAIASGTGIDLEWIFCGLLMALPVLIGWTALPLLDGLGRLRRWLAATLVASAYTVAAFYAQAGFKELLLTLFLLAAIGIVREAARPTGGPGWRVGVPIGLLCGSTVVSFSYGGLAWPVLTGLLWLGATAALALWAARRREKRTVARGATAWLRRMLPPVIAAGVAGAVTVASDLPRLIDSLNVFGASPAGTGSIVTENVGHLVGEVSKREIFGVWPREDFRFGFDQTLQNDLLALLAMAVAVYGVLWWLRRRDLAVPAAAAAAVLIAVRLSDAESAYTASKALAPAGALVMLMSIRAILADPPRLKLPGIRWIATVVAALFAGAALWSSFLVLRGSHVGPRDHSVELAEIETRLAGQPVLFLGNDDYAEWELRGSQALVLPATRPEKRWEFQQHPLDFDSVEPSTLDATPFVITTRTRYRSEPPANLRLVHSTPSYELWERRGPTPDREVLGTEGSQPGAILDCSSPAGRALAGRVGWARIWSQPPRLVEIPAGDRIVQAGEASVASVFLPRGTWEMSLPYVSSQRLHASLGDGGGSAAPNLGRSGPIWRIAELTQDRPGRRLVQLKVEEDGLGSNNHPALLSSLLFVRTDAPHRLIPLRRACGRYVDWYTLGAGRPST